MRAIQSTMPAFLIILLLGCIESDSSDQSAQIERLNSRVIYLEKQLEIKQQAESVKENALQEAERRVKIAEEKADRIQQNIKAPEVEAEKKKAAAEIKSAINPLMVSFDDIADDPIDYVGETITFLAWFDTSKIQRAQLEAEDEGLLLDGYVGPLWDGNKKPFTINAIGGERFYSYKLDLNPFLEKDYGRKIKAELKNQTLYKMKVTCKIVRVAAGGPLMLRYNVAVITKQEKVE